MNESTGNEMNGAIDGGASATKASREETRERWRGVVEEQRRGGESKRAFCRGRGISYQRFLAWAKRFADDGESAGSADGFHELRVGTPGVFPFPVAGAVFEIVSGDVAVRVASGFDETDLARLLRAVFEASRWFEEESRSVGVASGSHMKASRSTVNGSRSAVDEACSTGAPPRSDDKASRPAVEAIRPC